MTSDSSVNPVEDILSAITACLDRSSAEALLRLRAPAFLQARIEVLADRNTEGQISADEREELESLVRLGNFVGILQARARQQLASSAAA